jgi:hypothetical protein
MSAMFASLRPIQPGNVRVSAAAAHDRSVRRRLQTLVRRRRRLRCVATGPLQSCINLIDHWVASPAGRSTQRSTPFCSAMRTKKMSCDSAWHVGPRARKQWPHYRSSGRTRMTAGTAILRTCCRLVTASRSAVACRTSQPTASCDCYKRSAGLLGLTRKQSSLCVAVVPGGHEKICRLVGFIATNSTAGIRSDEGTNRVGLALELSFSGVEKALPALAASNRPSSKTARACASTAALPRRVPAVVQSGGTLSWTER